MKKYLPKLGGNNGSNGGDPNLLHGNDIKMMRYAEVLLIGAELYALDNRYFDALLNLNEVRARAGLPGISSNNQQEILDAIFNERRSEFMGEGHRYFDLIHFNKAAQYIDGFMNHHEIFPYQPVSLKLLEKCHKIMGINNKLIEITLKPYQLIRFYFSQSSVLKGLMGLLSVV